MNIYFNLLAQHAHVVKEKFVHTLTSRQKDILAIAAIALGCLAASYLIRSLYLYFKAEPAKPGGVRAFIYPDGSKWEFDRSRKDWYKVTWPNRTVAEGYFRNGELQGQGTITFPDKETWTGEFKPLAIIEQGNAFFRNGKIWSDQGKSTYSKDGTKQQTRLRGSVLHGPGIKTYPDGRKEEGIFDKGVLVKPKAT